MAESKIFDKFKYGNDTFIVQDNVSGYITSTAVATALDNKVDKVSGKGLSTNDYTTADQTKLAGIAAGAEVNVQANWNESNSASDAYIKNKPTIPTKTSDLTNDGDGTSAYARMSDIGSLGGGTITKVKTTAGAHTVIDVPSGDVKFNVPTHTSHLTNDSGFVSSLIGSTSTLTPTQVLTALQAGKTVYITHTHELYGNIVATYFDYSNTFSVIISNIITLYTNEFNQTVYMLFQLSGYLNNNTWGVHVTTLAEKTDIPNLATNNTTGITATTTATKTTLGTASSVIGVQSSTTTASKVTVGSHSTDYGVKTAGSGSYTQGAFTGGSFTQGTDSFTPNTPTIIDTTKFNDGSYSHTGFSGGSGSFTQGSFSGGSGSFSATVNNHVLSFSHTHTAATHGADSHTHNAATYGTDSFTPASLEDGFYTAGTAASFTQGEDEFTPATHGADSHTHTAPTLGSKIPTVSASNVTVPIKDTGSTSIPNVSVASATVTITDPGHTHQLSN